MLLENKEKETGGFLEVEVEMGLCGLVGSLQADEERRAPRDTK